MDKVLTKFRHPHTTQNDDVPVSEIFILFDATYVGKSSYKFYINISRLILKGSDVKIRRIYKAFKVGNNF